MLALDLSPETSAIAVPEVHTLRCRPVAPIDGLMFADSPMRLTVTTVPSSRVRVMLPSGNGTKVSALAAPAEKKPSATAEAAPTPASLAPFLMMLFISPLEGMNSRTRMDGRVGSADAERLAVQGGLDVVVPDDLEVRVR